LNRYLSLSTPNLILVAGLIFATAIAVIVSPGLFYLVLPRKLRLHEVEEAAALEFLKHEVFATRQRTGVLIYISLLERAVFVLADKGLLQKFDSKYWEGLGLKLAQDFNAHEAGRSFFAALDHMAPDFEKEFPPGADNPNELPDHLRH